MKLNRLSTRLVLVVMAFVTLSAIILLVVIFLKYMVNDQYDAKIPDYNYRLSKLVERNKNKQILARQLYVGDWQNVCFLGPYTLDASKILGFDWQIEDHTNVLDNDGHNVLVFVKNNQVLDFIIQNRTKGDFWKLSGQCLTQNSVLKINQKLNVDRIKLLN